MDIQSLCTTGVCFSSVDGLKEKLLDLRGKELVLFLSGSAAARFGLEGMAADLARQNHMTWIKKIPSNPTTADLTEVLSQLNGAPVDTLLAIGGGSAIDLAKGVKALYSGQESYEEEGVVGAIRERRYAEEKRALIAVPTTAGTGSELTAWATIWGTGGGEKHSVDAPFLKPDVALVVPELTLTIPVQLTLSTGLDALCHAVEAYWSRHTNPLVQALSYRACQLILDGLPRLVKAPGDLGLREQLCCASALAGLAFSQTRTTACHSISYPLTMQYGVTHGYACALTLAAVLERNRGTYPQWEQLDGLFAGRGGARAWLDKTCGEIVSLRLSAFGVERADLPGIAARAFTKGRMDNNPRALNEGAVLEILEEVY